MPRAILECPPEFLLLFLEPPNLTRLRALWSLLDGIWGVVPLNSSFLLPSGSKYVNIIPTLGPKVYGCYLLWAIRIPRVVIKI